MSEFRKLEKRIAIGVYNAELRKVDKRAARRAYNEGKDVLLLPCKVGLNSTIQPAKVSTYSSNGEDFDKVINSFEYYNCNNVLGKYTHFYLS